MGLVYVFAASKQKGHSLVRPPAVDGLSLEMNPSFYLEKRRPRSLPGNGLTGPDGHQSALVLLQGPSLAFDEPSDDRQKVIGREASPTTIKGAQKIGAWSPLAFMKSSSALRRAEATSCFSAKCV